MDTTIKTNKVVSWAAWDWGSAAFNAVATTFVFAVYLTGDGRFASSTTANEYLSWGMAIAGLVVALVAPVNGQKADREGAGVRSVGFFSFLVFLCLVGMFFVTPDSALGGQTMLVIGVALLGLGNIFFEFASVNYNGMLNYVSTPQNRGLVSGIGWGAGYLGGIVLLIVLFLGFINPDVGLFGVTSENGMDFRVSMLVAAAWFGAFSLPVVLNPPEGYGNPRGGQKLGIVDSYREVFRSIAQLWKQSRSTVQFLFASAVFRDGLAGVFTFGGVIAGTVFGFSASEIILFAIASNVVAGLSTIAVGKVDDILGPKLVIVVSLVSMIAAALAVFFFHGQGKIIFWVFGLALCIFVGPAQSASRSMMARLAPAGQEGELFGLYATTGRAVSFLAPAAYGLTIGLGKIVVPPGTTPDYWGILGIAAVLLAGLLLLLPVRAVSAADEATADVAMVRDGGAFPG